MTQEQSREQSHQRRREQNREQSYHYTTSQLAQYYGLTGKGLAFYESKGLLSPRRTPNMKYREFSLIDCYNLYDSKFYAKCGWRYI